MHYLGTLTKINSYEMDDITIPMHLPSIWLYR